MVNKRSHVKLPGNTKDFPKGFDLLNNPFLNKGTAFTDKERAALGLRGLLPPKINSESEQVARALENIRRYRTDFEKYMCMLALQNANRILFYRVLIDNLDELMPIVYTPTVGKACQEYGHIFLRPRGIFITGSDRGRIADILRNWPYSDVRIIVITDGERILGLGDLGADGMGIPVGKLALYTACAGIDPAQSLPVTIDVGTDNENLLNDPMYIGTKRHRLRGPEYDELFDEFIEAAKEVFPKALIQLEDFGNKNAFRLLKKYRSSACLFDDDIQGTGAVALAGIYSALRITGQPLRDQKILFLGAGEAGIGIADLIVAALCDHGLSEQEARRRCWFVDSQGLVVKSRTDLAEHKLPYAHEGEYIESLLESVKTLKPTALIGVSGKTGMFDSHVLHAMAEHNERPIIFALSNPTKKAECTARDAYGCTDGRAIFASGSPFAPVHYNDTTFVPGQGNNAYIFPGVGLGAIASGSRSVPDEMFFIAAKTLADTVSDKDLASGRIFPPLMKIRDVSAKIAAAVAGVAYRRGIATEKEPADILSFVQSVMWDPTYQDYVE